MLNPTFVLLHQSRVGEYEMEHLQCLGLVLFVEAAGGAREDGGGEGTLAERPEGVGIALKEKNWYGASAVRADQ